MERLILVLIAIFLVFFSITYLFHKLFKTKRFAKYLPSVLSLIGSIVNLILVRTTHREGFKDLAYFLMSMLLFAGFISGLISALWFDFISKKDIDNN
ncbi:hypothetical protein JK636_00190 [Clostridium sp. YIM B02515]|uniref:Uncharacterized protein n=1 Tax=Clostridium rhizosphaerae TaxID=2803861 RepID=A0ABS1T4B9_9CLOT|nr:hypothetical protein [Clostridium rhizosphaerae]MBL4934169.1 hypothetical protein [Clostridium rhizosphaerae]